MHETAPTKFTGAKKYVLDEELAKIVNVTMGLEMPLLLKGEPGTGKTMLAHAISEAFGMRLIVLNVKSSMKLIDALYQYDTLTRLNDSRFGDSKRDVSNIEDYIKMGKIGQAFVADKRVVLLIDEIDKADAEFEAFLLELLSDFQVTVPEIGTFKAHQIPLVVLTSNNAREMSDALKRRCLHLYIDFPEREQELAIIKLKAPESADKLAAEVVTVVQSLRKLDLKKSPGISETIDWVKALTLLNVQNLDQDLVNETLDTIVKYEGDVRKAQEELKEYVRRARTRRGSDTGPAGGPPASDKDLLN